MLHLNPLRLITLRATTPALLRLATAMLGLVAALSPAQAPTPQQPAAGRQNNASPTQSAKPSTARKRSPAKAAAVAQQPVPEAPPAPPAPVWPANKAPAQAHITWDSHGLKVEAANSSLDQILKEVSTITGSKVEGFSHDQRIFGTYGPGPAREVLSRLLDGSGYNVLMVGGIGDAPPRQIVLSTAGPAGPQPPPGTQTQENDNDIEVETDNTQFPEPPPMPPQQPPQETPQPTPIRNPFGMPMPPGSPQPMPPQPMPPEQQSQPNAPPQ